MRVLLDQPARTAFWTEAGRVRTWLESQAPQGKGLVAFSCSPRSLWHTDVLAVRVMTHLAFEPQPDLAPLLKLVDEYERYAVAVVDQESARLVTVFLGEIEEAERVEGGVRGIAERLAERYRVRRFDRLVLAGPEQATAGLRRLLPSALGQRVVGVVPAEGLVDDRAILRAVLEIERRVEREDEERLVRQLLEQVARGRAILGVRPTLAALWADQVQTLVVAHSIRGDGSECPTCWRLEPGHIETCPKCGDRMRPVHDLFHRAMQRAIDQAGSAEVVFGDAERELNRVGGGLGALLRAA
jgi:hypothetical protein